MIVPELRSVARIRLLETENPSACATVNWKLCKSGIALHLLYLRERFYKEGSINSIVQSKPVN
jgi:hypothetical protein